MGVRHASAHGLGDAREHGSRKGFVETRFRASHAGIDMRGGRTSVVAGPSQSAAPLLTRLTRAYLARRTLLGAEACEPPRVQGLAEYDCATATFRQRAGVSRLR